MGKQTEKQVDALESLNLSNQTDKLTQIEGLFPKKLFNVLIIDSLKEIIKLKDIIKTD